MVSATADQGTYDPATGQWDVGTVGGGSSRDADRSWRTVDEPGASDEHGNGERFGAVRPEHDQQHGERAGDAAAGRPGVTKTVGDPSPNVGDTVTFTVTLTTMGPDAANGVKLGTCCRPGVVPVATGEPG